MARNPKLLPGVLSLLALAGSAHADASCDASEVLRIASSAASRVTTCPATADDLGAEATLRFLRARNGAPTGDPVPAAYIRRIVDNVRRDWQRRGDRVLPLSAIETLHLEDGHDDPAEAAEVAEFVAGLEPEKRMILELMIEGFGEREIALRTENTRHAVRALMNGIRAKASEFFDSSTGVLV